MQKSTEANNDLTVRLDVQLMPLFITLNTYVLTRGLAPDLCSCLPSHFTPLHRLRQPRTRCSWPSISPPPIPLTHFPNNSTPQAEATLHKMQLAGYKPRDFAYCGLIAAYSLAGQHERALAVRARARREGLQPSVHVYNASLAVCERQGNVELALELLQAMHKEVGAV